jgi:hypothetical protein
MFRKTILTAAVALAAFTGLASTPSNASANPPIGHGRPVFCRFEVLVLRHGCWDKVGVFRDRDDARRAARPYRMHGLRVKIEQC